MYTCTANLFRNVPRCIRLHTDTHTTCPCPLLDRHSHMSTPDASNRLHLTTNRRIAITDIQCTATSKKNIYWISLTQVKPSVSRRQRRHVRYLYWQQLTRASVGRDINWHAPWRQATRGCTPDDWTSCFNVVPWCDVKTFVWHRHDADVVYLLWRHVNTSIHQQHNKAPVYNYHHDVMPQK